MIKYLRTLPLNGDLHVNAAASGLSEYSQFPSMVRGCERIRKINRHEIHVQGIENCDLSIDKLKSIVKKLLVTHEITTFSTYYVVKISISCQHTRHSQIIIVTPR